MAGRFVIQKLVSGISRSRASLGAHGPSARAAAPAAGTPPVAGAVSAARYFSRTSMPSVIINPVKPACLDSFGGAKEPLSSMASTRHQISRKERMAAFEAKMDAITADGLAQDEALRAELKAYFADFNKFVIKVTMLSCFAGSCVLWALFEKEKRRIKARLVWGRSSPRHAVAGHTVVWQLWPEWCGGGGQNIRHSRHTPCMLDDEILQQNDNE